MDEKILVFSSGKRFRDWKSRNCVGCRKKAGTWMSCDLAAALQEALHHDEVVPLRLAERIGYFDLAEGEPPGADLWRCREFEPGPGGPTPPAPSFRQA